MNLFKRLFCKTQLANKNAAEHAFIEFLTTTGNLLDARVADEPEPNAMLLKRSFMLLSMAEDDSEYDRTYCDIKARLEKYYDSTIMKFVEQHVVDIKEVEVEFLKLRDVCKCEIIDEFVKRHAKEDGSTGLEILCYMLSFYLMHPATANDSRCEPHETGEDERTRFIKSIESGVCLGEVFLESIRKRYVFDSRLLFDCVQFDMLLKKTLNDDMSEASERSAQLHLNLIETIKQKKSMWLKQVVNADCRNQVEIAIEKLLPIAYESLLLYLYEKQIGGANALLNEKYIHAHGDVEGNTLRYSIYKALKFPGIEEEFPKDRIMSELKMKDNG